MATQFAGNVLIVHNPFGHPFTVNYTVVYREYELSKDNRVETVQSMPSHLQGKKPFMTHGICIVS